MEGFKTLVMIGFGAMAAYAMFGAAGIVVLGVMVFFAVGKAG